MKGVNERGAAAVEYGILIGAVAAVIVFTVYGLGTKVAQGFQLLDGLWT